MYRYTAIHCLGRFHVVPNQGDSIPRHVSALLAILAASDRPLERTTVADLLWDGDDPSKKRHSLSQILYSIRKTSPDCVVVAADRIALNNTIWRDTVAFEAAIASNDVHAALDLYTGTFLDGFPYVTDSFDDWRVGKAARYEEDVVAICTDLIALRGAAEDHAAVAEVAKRALLIRPVDEAFARARVEALASSGDSMRALRELDSYRKRIVTETGSYPSSLSDSFAEAIARMPSGLTPVSQPGTPMRLVGRTAELASIRAHLNSHPRHTRVVLIQGEHGIGKTRVLQHAARRAAIEGARVFMYSCAEAESRLPQSGIVGLIRDGFRRHDLEELDVGWRDVIGELLPELFGGATPRTHPERVIWEGAAQYFAAIAHRNAVALALDDMQWLDDSSHNVITYILKRHPELRLLFLAAGRAPLRAPVYEDDRPSTITINLKELSSEAVHDLIAEFEKLNDFPVPARARNEIEEKVGGRPFFLLQALAHLKLHGESSIGPDLLPPNVTTYIERRLSTLSQNARQVAEALAVLNRSVPIHMLAVAAQLSVVDVSRSLDELVTNSLVADQPTPKFSHELIRQAVLLGLPEAVLCGWHARIASAFVSGNSSETSEIASYHFECAGDMASAHHHALIAAAAAYRTAEYSKSSECYARALRCSPIDSRLDILAKFSTVLARTGNFAPLYPHLQELEGMFRSNGDHEGLTLCMLARFTRDEASGGSEMLQSVQSAKAILASTERHLPGQIATVLWQVADAIRRSGEPELLAQFARLLVTQARNAVAAHKVEMLSAGALLGGISIGYRFAKPLVDEAIAISQKLPSGILHVRALFACGTVRLWSGELHEARNAYESALQVADEHVVGQILSSIKSNYSIVLIEQCDYAGAEAMALESLREAGAPRRGYAFGNLAMIKLRCQDWEGVRHYAQALQDSHATTPHSWIPAHFEALMGLADIGEGNTASALSRASRLEENMPFTDPMVDSTHLHLFLANADYLRGNSESAELRLRSSIEAIQQLDVVAATRIQIELVKLLADTGRGAMSSRLLDEARGYAERGGMLCLLQQAAQLQVLTL